MNNSTTAARAESYSEIYLIHYRIMS